MSGLVGFDAKGRSGSYVGTVRAVEYHRNGISGLGFYLVRFDLDDRQWPAMHGKPFSAVVCEKEADSDAGAVCVFVTADGVDLCDMRGDRFADELRRIVATAKWQHEVDAEKVARAQAPR